MSSNNRNNDETAISHPPPPQQQQYEYSPQQQKFRTMLKPKVYRFKCQGLYTMHHSDVGSKGVCYGLASRLRYVRDLPLDPSEAVDDFVAGIDMPTRELPGGRTTTNPNGMETRNGGTGRPGYPLQQHRDFHSQQRHPPQDQQPNMRNNNNNNNSSNIKRNVNHDNEEDEHWNPQTMVYGQLKDRQTHPSKSSLQYNNNSSSSSQDTIPHNESDEKVTRLRAVGCTHIEVLVLEGTKRRKPPASVWSAWRPKTSTPAHPSVGHVLALAADCTHGVHYVDAATSKARETYTQTYCFALAPFFSHGLHIHFAPNHNHRRNGGNGDLENRLANDTATAGLVGALTNSVDGPTATSTNSVGTTTAATAASMQHSNNSNNNNTTTTRGDNDYNNNHHTLPQEQNIGRISHETIMNGTARLFRAAQYGTTKLWGSMRTNALLLHKSATRPDYPSRVVQSGEKIIHNLPKTFQRTTKLMGDVYKLWTTDDDDDDDDFNGSGRGGW